jgi:hypothetical protein
MPSYIGMEAAHGRARHQNKKKLPPMCGQGTEWVNVPTAEVHLPYQLYIRRTRPNPPHHARISADVTGGKSIAEIESMLMCISNDLSV